jgi:hypothetical protein
LAHQILPQFKSRFIAREIAEVMREESLRGISDCQHYASSFAPDKLPSKLTLSWKMVESFDASYVRMTTGPFVNGEYCWIWKGEIAENGYGVFWGDCGPNSYYGDYAHRYSWRRSHKETLNRSDVIMHACDVRPCVNPAHLNRGTHLENVRDMWAKGRAGRRRPQKLPLVFAIQSRQLFQSRQSRQP